MAPHLNCLCCSTESAGGGDSDIPWDNRFGRGGKGLSGDWGREPSGSWMAFRVSDRAHPSPPAGMSRLPWLLETLPCYLTHSLSPTWWQAAKGTSPEPEPPKPSSSRVLTPSACHDTALRSGPWETLLCTWIATSSFLISESFAPTILAFWRRTFNVDSLLFVSGPSTQKEWTWMCLSNIMGVLENLVASLWFSWHTGQNLEHNCCSAPLSSFSSVS